MEALSSHLEEITDPTTGISVNDFLQSVLDEIQKIVGMMLVLTKSAINATNMTHLKAVVDSRSGAT
eukprot:1308331-Amphidinium_carterae.1